MTETNALNTHSSALLTVGPHGSDSLGDQQQIVDLRSFKLGQSSVAETLS